MGWDNITGDAKIIPTGGNINEVRFESGKPRKIRLLLRDGEQPYSYLEHALEIENVENGQTTRVFRTIRCAKTANNPNAYCPLCEGQQLRRRARNAANVWDYESNSVQKLNAGDSVWKPIATTRKLGVDILSVDWAIMKSGQTRNDTEYATTNLGASAFQLPADAQLFDIEQEYAPHTVDEMKAIVESCGIAWESVITPPELQFPTLQDALAHKMPNGQHKDKTFKQMWDEDPSPRGMINFLATKSNRVTPEKAAAQVILVNLGGAHIPGVPVYDSNGTVQINSTPASAPITPTVNPTVKPMATPSVSTTIGQSPTATSNARQDKINKINSYLSTKDKFVNGGFSVVIDTMKSVSGGKTNISDFSDAELDAMIEACEK
jgi:hypothetical protein